MSQKFSTEILLENAVFMCVKYQLNHLLQVMEYERDQLTQLLTAWENIIQNNKELLAKIDDVN